MQEALVSQLKAMKEAHDVCQAQDSWKKATKDRLLLHIQDQQASTPVETFSGVEKVFAIQAGREVRVFVNSREINDLESEKLSFEIARKIEKNCQYPGEVRVSVHREAKFEDTAK